MLIAGKREHEYAMRADRRPRTRRLARSALGIHVRVHTAAHAVFFRPCRQRFAGLLKDEAKMKNTLPEYIVNMYENEALKTSSPRDFRTKLINKLFKRRRSLLFTFPKLV